MERIPNIGVLIMCKNETKRLYVTLNSIIGYAHSLIIYDTGSTDDTIEIAENFTRLNNIPLHLKQGEFVDFATSRNISLEFIDQFTEIDYILLLDVNDELRNGDKLKEYCKEHLNCPSTGFLLCQQWQTGSLDKYYNMRLIKARSGWRYFGRVHEWMKNTLFEDGKGPIVLRAPDNIIIYQDRTQDDNKSSTRFIRDKILLKEEHRQNQYEPRTLFYLAQTCSCLNQHEESIYYYKLRLNVEGFQEERFHSFLRIGDISISLKNPWHDSLQWFMKAYEHSRRAEPLVKITEFYISTKQYDIGYVFATLACSLHYPEHAILFVEKHTYDYKRWHLLSVAALYTNNFEIGKPACLKALTIEPNSQMDKQILKIYEINENNRLKETSDIIQSENNLTTKNLLQNESVNTKQIMSKKNKKKNK